MFSMIPFPVKLVVFALLFLGAIGYGYMKGSAAAENSMLDYKANAEKQISDLKDENAKIANQVTTEYVDRTNTVREKEIIYRNTVTELKPQHDLSNGWIHLHDAAARLVNPDMQLASDVSPSGIMDTSALAVVMNNYTICKQNADQLAALQKWVRDNKAASDAANASNPKENR